MSLQNQIETDVILALKAHDEIKVSVLRLLKNAIANTAIAAQKELTNEEIISVIKKQAKDRQEAMTLYKAADKTEAFQKEAAELTILETYLPEDMPESQLLPLIDEALTKVQPSGMADFGKVMGFLMPQVKGKVDGTRLAELVKQKLNS